MGVLVISQTNEYDITMSRVVEFHLHLFSFKKKILIKSGPVVSTLRHQAGVRVRA